MLGHCEIEKAQKLRGNSNWQKEMRHPCTQKKDARPINCQEVPDPSFHTYAFLMEVFA